MVQITAVRNMCADLLPARAGVLSAEGMLASEPGRDLSQAMPGLLTELSEEAIRATFGRLQQDAQAELGEEGVHPDQIRYRRQFELRYRGQSATFVLDCEEDPDPSAAFHAAHEKASGHRLDQPVELVNLRLSARATAEIRSMEKLRETVARPEDRQTYLAELRRAVPLLEREQLSPGFRARGPAIITENVATTWLAPGWSLEVDDHGHLSLTRS
jgi:N-methylhydantoinase A